jgi:hypothetical protein
MKLEALVVCINYSDFLSHTLPYNKNFFDRMVVVTDTKDIKTHKLCELWNVQCVKTDVFYLDNPNVPNKSRGINEGLKQLSQDGWVLQMDADIWLPPLTRDILEGYPLDAKKLYSMDRLMCDSFEDWYDFIHVQHKSIHEGWVYLHTTHFPVGTRIVQYRSSEVDNSLGYQPIGYFQMWNPTGSGISDYPVEISGFDRTDVVHLKRWKREDRVLMADLVCVHLASEDHTQAQNWFGRKTKMFGPRVSTLPVWAQTTQKVMNFAKSIYYSVANWVKRITTRKISY